MVISSRNKKSEYTKTRITDALFSLMKKEAFSDITILQITQTAGVSRAAFYRNFETKEDIIDYSVHKKITEYMEHAEHDPEKILFDELAFINLWANEKDFFLLIYKNDLMSAFIKHYKNFMKDYLFTTFGTNSDYYDYFASQIAYGTLGILDAWLQHDCRESKEELLEIIARLRNSMLQRTL